MHNAEDRFTAVLSRKLPVFTDAANIYTYPLGEEWVFERDIGSKEGICVSTNNLKLQIMVNKFGEFVLALGKGTELF